jgi:hypothetical protein
MTERNVIDILQNTILQAHHFKTLITYLTQEIFIIRIAHHGHTTSV